jgi:hypothetical protein
LWHILRGELTSSSHHLSPAFHHKFTIKKPPSAPRFSPKPLQKHPSTRQKNNAQKQQQSRSSAVILFESGSVAGREDHVNVGGADVRTGLHHRSPKDGVEGRSCGGRQA